MLEYDYHLYQETALGAIIVPFAQTSFVGSKVPPKFDAPRIDQGFTKSLHRLALISPHTKYITFEHDGDLN